MMHARARRLGYSCADWGSGLGFPCEEAPSDGYTQDELGDLLQACRRACAAPSGESTRVGGARAQEGKRKDGTK